MNTSTFSSLTKEHAAALPGAHNTTRVELPNGIIVLTRPNFNSLSVNIGGYIHTGALLEPDEKLGLADFVSTMLMRGTQRRTFQEIFDTLESCGASLGYSSAVHTTAFGGKALAEDLDVLLDVLAETLRTPSFPAEQVERRRGQMLTQLAIRAQSTDSMASLAFDKMIYPNHPYSRPEDGYPETVSAIRREDMQEFHQRSYGPHGMVITIVGAVEPQAAVEKVARALGDWQNEAQVQLPALPPLARLEAIQRQAVPIEGKSQSTILMGVAGLPRSHPDYMTASLGNNILGQFGMYGRIGESVREQEGLVYYAYSVLSGGFGPGPWYVTAGAAPQNVERVIELVREELARFLREPVTRQELDDSQTHYIGVLPLSMETNEGVTAALLNLERYHLGLDYYLRYADIVRAATPESILELSRQYLHPDRLGIAVAGGLEPA